MNADVLSWIQALLPAATAALGAYGAIHARLKHVEKSAERAHERIDDLLRADR